MLEVTFVLGFIYLFICGIIFNVQLVSKSGSKPENNSSFLDALKRHRANGYEKLSDLIKYLDKGSEDLSPVMPVNTDENIDKNKTQSNSFTSPAIDSTINNSIKQSKKVEQKTRQKLDQANVLLYLGSGLVVFSAFIFVAFNWQNFGPMVKLIILLLVNLSFFVAGLVAQGFPRVKQAATTLLITACIILIFSGMGVWVWAIAPALGTVTETTFFIYWGVFSLILGLVYGIVSRLIVSKNFAYLILLTIYSFLLSLSVALTTDNNFRIVVFALLNLGLYASEGFFKKLSINTNLIIRIMSHILNIVIFMVVVTNWDSIVYDNLKLPAILALAIPFVFNIIALFKEKSASEGYAEQLFLPLRVALIGSFFSQSLEFFCYLFLLLAVIQGLCNYLIYILKPNSGLNTLGKVVFWVLSSLVLIANLAVWVSQSFYLISEISGLYLISLGFLCTLAFSLLHKNKWETALALCYIPILNLKIWDVLPGTINHHAALYSSLIMFVALNFIAYFVRTSSWKYVFTPVLIFLGLLSSGLSLNFGPDIIAINFLIIGVTLSLSSRIRQMYWSNFVAVAANYIGYLALIAYFFENRIAKDLDFGLISLILFIPALIYAVLYDFESKISLRVSNFLGMVGFGLTSLTVSSLDNRLYTFCLLSTVLVYTFYRIFKAQIEISVLANFGVSLTWIWVFSDMLKINTFGIGAILSIYSILLYLITSPTLSYIKPKIKDLIFVLANIVSAFVFFKVIYDFSTRDLWYLLELGLWTASILVAGMKNKYFNYLAGFGLVLGSWWLVQFSGGSSQTQLYVLPLTVYLLVVSYFLDFQGKKSLSRVFEMLAYIWQFSSLFIQSIPSSGEGIFYGLILILLTSIAIPFGVSRKRQPLVIIGSVFLGLELILRLYSVFLAIPWYIYLLLIGVGLIAWAIHVLNKNVKDK